MNKINELTVNNSKNSVHWIYAGNKIQISADNIGQAVEDTIHEKVLVSLCKGKHPYQIKVYALTGEELLSFNEPELFEFYYLKQHSSYGVSIVCTADEAVDGRMDWQFEINYETGQLIRVAPSM